MLWVAFALLLVDCGLVLRWFWLQFDWFWLGFALVLPSFCLGFGLESERGRKDLEGVREDLKAVGQKAGSERV